MPHIANHRGAEAPELMLVPQVLHAQLRTVTKYTQAANGRHRRLQWPHGPWPTRHTKATRNPPYEGQRDRSPGACRVRLRIFAGASAALCPRPVPPALAHLTRCSPPSPPAGRSRWPGTARQCRESRPRPQQRRRQQRLGLGSRQRRKGRMAHRVEGRGPRSGGWRCRLHPGGTRRRRAEHTRGSVKTASLHAGICRTLNGTLQRRPSGPATLRCGILSAHIKPVIGVHEVIMRRGGI